MLLDKGSELLPVCDFVAVTTSVLCFRLTVARLSLALEPYVDGVAADVESFTGFAAFHPIEFDSFNDFAA